jgi:hypothetical protein
MVLLCYPVPQRMFLPWEPVGNQTREPGCNRQAFYPSAIRHTTNHEYALFENECGVNAKICAFSLKR